jgi:hypothetical protein
MQEKATEKEAAQQRRAAKKEATAQRAAKRAEVRKELQVTTSLKKHKRDPSTAGAPVSVVALVGGREVECQVAWEPVALWASPAPVGHSCRVALPIGG